MALSRTCLRSNLFSYFAPKTLRLFTPNTQRYSHVSIIGISSRCFSCGVMSNMNGHVTDPEVKNPSNFKKIQYGVPKDSIGRVLGKEKQTVNEIKALSGCVIRLKKHQDAHDDPDKGYFVIGGSHEQINKATELIEKKISRKAGPGFNDEGAPIWASYRRNFKGQFPPQNTRRKCIRYNGNSGNPCSLCKLKLEKDREVDYKDVDLLKQFVCPHTWKILEPSTTGLCRNQQRKLEDEIIKSRLYGLLPFTITLPDDSPIPYKPAGIPRKTARIRY